VVGRRIDVVKKEAGESSWVAQKCGGKKRWGKKSKRQRSLDILLPFSLFNHHVFGPVMGTKYTCHVSQLSHCVRTECRAASCLPSSRALYTMSLRRRAHENHAGTVPGSPRSPQSTTSAPSLPSTPRSRVSIGVYRSPASTPSLSASVPFDWEAARAHAAPPYGTPLQRKARKSMVPVTPKTPRKALVRRKSFWQKWVAIRAKCRLSLNFLFLQDARSTFIDRFPPLNVPSEPTTSFRKDFVATHRWHDALYPLLITCRPISSRLLFG
jgi:hypothetical protein